MAMKKVSVANLLANRKRQHGKSGWRGLCLKSVRLAANDPGGVATARDAGKRVPMEHRHTSLPVPKGAICFAYGPGSAGHVWIAEDGKGAISTNDYPTSGVIKVTTMSKMAAAWGYRQKPTNEFNSNGDWFWTDRVNNSHIYDLLSGGGAGGSKYRQDGDVYSSKMKYGVKNSDSVWNLQLALGKHYRRNVPTGNYLAATVAAVKRFQQAQGWTGKDADGIAGPATIKALGLNWVKG